MNIKEKFVLPLLITGSAALGGVGATAIGAIQAPAPTTAATTTAATRQAPSGTFKPNEDPTHEAGESAAREAQENAGQMPTAPQAGPPTGAARDTRGDAPHP